MEDKQKGTVMIRCYLNSEWLHPFFYSWGFAHPTPPMDELRSDGPFERWLWAAEKRRAIEQTTQGLVAMTMEKDPEVTEKVQFLLEQWGIVASFQSSSLQCPSMEQHRL